MDMNKNSRIGGILAIISGGLGILWGILLLANLQYAYLWGIVLAGGILQIIGGIICIVGGYVSMQHKLWGLALFGAIVGIFTFFPTAVAAIVLIVLGKKDFKLAGSLA
jgi:ABC-type sulfate transport system permease component